MTQSILAADVARLAALGSPDLVDAILALIEEGEPLPQEPAPPDRLSLAGLRAALVVAGRKRLRDDRGAAAQTAWQRYVAQPPELVAPQLELADLIVTLYELASGETTEQAGPARVALLRIAREAPLVFGVWGGLKRVFKRAEADLDAEIFGAIAARVDVAAALGASGAQDVRPATLVYLCRRAARFLRHLGKAVPELYPSFCVEVLRAYPAASGSTRITSDVRRGTSTKWGAPQELPKTKTFRPAYLEAWKLRPDPLMLLLETCEADFAASFAIQGLRELFPDALRGVSPAWLARLAMRPLPTAHEFVVATLEASPAFHQGKLRAIGLHDAVLALLLSPSVKARTYAIAYARTQSVDLSTPFLVQLLAQADRVFTDTAAFAAEAITARPVRQIGVALLGRLVAFAPTSTWARHVLDNEIDKKEIDDAFLIEMLLSGGVLQRGGRPYVDSARASWAQEHLDKKRPGEVPMAFWLRALDDERARVPMPGVNINVWLAQQLTKLDVATAPADWLFEVLGSNLGFRRSIESWLTAAEKLPPGFDVERLKGLVFDAERRGVALALLGNPKLVLPGQIGLGWLLALARRADPTLHTWAHRYLLTHMRPEHFAEGKPNAKKGIERLFTLALGAREPEAVRAFAQTYLRCHHPEIGKDQPESRQLDVKPGIPRDAFTMERVWPALFDARPDVRRFAVLITRVELRRWGAQPRVYELAESSAKEVRRVAYDALQQAGEDWADPALALTPEELDAAQIFSMTESRARASRDVAIELIRKHYGRIGGAARLGWLMQSADREVRFFAVRLLWEKHRPRGVPAEWKAPGGTSTATEPFKDAEQLRALLRRLLFSVPPPRSMEQLEGARVRKLPASVTKRSLIEIVRDVAIADAGFAALVAPLLEEFTGSVAKGEWQACLAALLTLRKVHGAAIAEAAG